MKLSPPIRPSESLAASGGGGLPRPRAKPRQSPFERLRPKSPLGWYAWLVLLPTLLVGVYYVAFASEMYESDARFLVRGRSSGGGGGGGAASSIASMIGSAGGATRPGAEEAQAVKAYIDSNDGMQALGRRLDLVSIWRPTDADPISRLWHAEPMSEDLLKYYRRRVSVEYDLETGLMTLHTIAYRPEDAKAIAEGLIGLSEDLVNRFSARTSADTLRVGREEVAIAELRVLEARAALTSFREREQALDPTASVGAAVQTIGRLEATLSQTRAELQEKQAFMRPDNPQIQVLNNRITAIVAQIAAERSRRTSGDETLTQQLSGYERLNLEREFAERTYASALSSQEAARADAQRQQVFLMRVVEPNLAEKSTFPRATFNTMTLLVVLTVFFAIGWLVIAGAREHAS